MTIGLTITPRGRFSLRLGLAVAASLALATGGWIWLRDSSLVRVRDVEITGVTASDGARVRAALEGAALELTTLHVREEVLRLATASYSSVAALRVRADFPRRLRIHVVEQQPVAALAGIGDGRVPVTGSGLVLRGLTADRDLPTLELARPAIGARVGDRRALRALAVARAAPAPLLHRSDQLEVGSRGVVVALREGPELVFGTGEDAREVGCGGTRAGRAVGEGCDLSRPADPRSRGRRRPCSCGSRGATGEPST